MADDLASAIIAQANRLGVNPLDLGTAISYETAGTFDPWKAGPTTQWGQHRGLIQWGEPQRQKYGVSQGMPVGDQMAAAARYLQDAGVKPGMGLMDIYSAINAGRVGRYGASDAGNGGAPGTVADKVNNQMAAHRQKAEALLSGANPFARVPGGPAMMTGAGGSAPTRPSAPAAVAGPVQDALTPAQAALLSGPSSPQSDLVASLGLGPRPDQSDTAALASMFTPEGPSPAAAVPKAALSLASTVTGPNAAPSSLGPLGDLLAKQRQQLALAQQAGQAPVPNATAQPAAAGLSQLFLS